MRPYEEVSNAVTGQINMIYMLQYLAPGMATQEAFNQARKLLVEAEVSGPLMGTFASSSRPPATKQRISIQSRNS